MKIVTAFSNLPKKKENRLISFLSFPFFSDSFRHFLVPIWKDFCERRTRPWLELLNEKKIGNITQDILPVQNVQPTSPPGSVVSACIASLVLRSLSLLSHAEILSNRSQEFRKCC